MLMFVRFQKVSTVNNCSLVCCFVWHPGGAPNYYPNSFSAPHTQPRFVESKFKVSPDVARYNSEDEDNVTQVPMSPRPSVTGAF